MGKDPTSGARPRRLSGNEWLRDQQPVAQFLAKGTRDRVRASRGANGRADGARNTSCPVMDFTGGPKADYRVHLDIGRSTSMKKPRRSQGTPSCSGPRVDRPIIGEASASKTGPPVHQDFLEAQSPALRKRRTGLPSLLESSPAPLGAFGSFVD